MILWMNSVSGCFSTLNLFCFISMAFYMPRSCSVPIQLAYYHFVFRFTFVRRTWMKIIIFNGVLFLHWASHKRHVIFKLKQIKSIIHIYISSTWERKEGKQMCASWNTTFNIHKHTWNCSFIHKFIMSQLNSNWFVNFGVAGVVKWALMSL